MRAGLLSHPEVIEKLNRRFVTTTNTISDITRLAKSGDELARKIFERKLGAVNLLFLTSEGTFVSVLDPTVELTDIHPDTTFRPGQKRDASSERNTRVFLKHVNDHFGP